MRAADQARGVHDRSQDDANDDEHDRQLDQRPTPHPHGTKPTRYVRISATVAERKMSSAPPSERSGPFEKMVIATVLPDGLLLEMPPSLLLVLGLRIIR